MHGFCIVIGFFIFGGTGFAMASHWDYPGILGAIVGIALVVLVAVLDDLEGRPHI